MVERFLVGSYSNMLKNTGITPPGIPTECNKPHLGDLLLKKYKGRICTGFDDLEKFELILQRHFTLDIFEP
jgi:hypothetical protein